MRFRQETGATIVPIGIGNTPVAPDWRAALPTISGPLVTVRPLRASDAPALMSSLTADEVTRFIAPGPTTIDGFERFIVSTQRQREAGTGLCFAIVPGGMDEAIGLLQVRQLEPRFETAEWGFAIGSTFWGTGLFMEAAQSVLAFAFGVVGVFRMEARVPVRNGRGNGVMRKLGAMQEGVLRRSLIRAGQFHDQVLWTILADEWTETQRVAAAPRVH